MVYKLFYHPEVVDSDLPKVPKNMRETIRKAVEERLLIDPTKFGQPLRQSLRGHRKLRVCDYRIIYRIEGNEIIVLKIGHRKEVYNKALSRIRALSK